MYYSEEINNAKKYGYKFEIIKGYLFDKQDIFSNYVNDLNIIKENAKKNNDQAWYLIAKLLLNSLYGRFGMNPVQETHKIINDDDFVITTISNNFLIFY